MKLIDILFRPVCWIIGHAYPVGCIVVRDYVLGERLRYDSMMVCGRCYKPLPEVEASIQSVRARLVSPAGIVSADDCTVECATRWCAANRGWNWIPGARDES